MAVADVEAEGDYCFERCTVGTSTAQLRALAEWLVQRDVEEIVTQRAAHAAGRGGRWHRSDNYRLARRRAIASDTRTTSRCAGRLRNAASGVPPTPSMTLVELGMINEQIAKLDQQMATLLTQHKLNPAAPRKDV